MNAVKKTRQMLLLEEKKHGIRMQFNEKLLCLRDQKLAVVETAKKVSLSWLPICSKQPRNSRDL